MSSASPFARVLEEAANLSTEDQEAMIDILHRRIVDRRREILASEVQESRAEYDEGLCRPATPEDLAEEILS
jgi:hypothetical protein